MTHDIPVEGSTVAVTLYDALFSRPSLSSKLSAVTVTVIFAFVLDAFDPT